MSKKRVPDVTAKIKLTLHAEERFFGPGICELLERIRDTGSIQAAAASMEMSYTKAWKILKRAERIMGEKLISTTSGGRAGGSSRLTASGERAVRAFREMESELIRVSSGLLESYRDLFMGGPDS